MKRLLRKCLIVLSAGLAGFAAFAASAQGSYPDKPVRLIVPWTAGGTTDLVARTIAERLGMRLSQPVVVENRPGATGQIGSQQVARAEPDGYTLLLMAATVHTVSPNLSKSFPFDPIDDFTNISQVVSFPYVMVVSAASPYKSVTDLAEAARKSPGTISYGSFGVSSAPYLISELFAMSTGTKLLHVPYKGAAPATQDLLGGRIDFFIDSLPSPLSHIRGGTLRALSVTTPERSALLPETPAMDESLPGFQAIAWIGIGGPKGMPDAIADRLNSELKAIASEPAYQEKLREMGLEATASVSPAQFRAWLIEQKKYWEDFVRKAGIPVGE